jgi:hypothetical protein
MFSTAKFPDRSEGLTCIENIDFERSAKPACAAGCEGRGMRFSALLLAPFAFACCVGLAGGQPSVEGAPPVSGAADAGDRPWVLSSTPDEGCSGTFYASFRVTPAADSVNESSQPMVSPESSPGPTTDVHGFYPGDDRCGGLDDFHRALCQECPTWSLQTFVSYDSWRGISDDDWQNNGINVGANFGTRLGPFSDATGIGFQIGGSVGVYNWSGAGYQSDVETQGFITYGFFRRPNGASGWTAGLVQDWMLNDHFGQFSQDPTLSQLRAQVGYATSASNEIGLWGAARVLGATRDVNGVGATTWRPIDQLNLYWHHKWQLGGADTSIWIGIPEQDRLGASGSLGEYLAGASATVPLNDRIALFTLVTYMHPSSGPSANGAEEEAWNFTVGVSFSLGRDTRSSTVAGQSWMPLMPLANNGYFLVDTNQH